MRIFELHRGNGRLGCTCICETLEEGFSFGSVRLVGTEFGMIPVFLAKVEHECPDSERTLSHPYISYFSDRKSVV